MEVASLEEPHASALAKIAEKVELLVREEAAGTIVKRLEIFHELSLALVKRHGADLDDVRVEIQERLVQMPTEPDRLHPVKFPRL